MATVGDHGAMADRPVKVTTKYGSLLGTRRHANFGFDDAETAIVDEFLGIPYAAPPVGDLRWQPPREPEPWKNVRPATTHGHVCPQPVASRCKLCAVKYQDEDCLYLNVFSPYKADAPEAGYPVMLYVHGGSYTRGSGNLFNGTALAQYGVVVVTINYRLFALGFLSSGDGVIPGNYGLMDQLQALIWVRQNIGHFRGDASAITLVGNSAGSSSVLLLSMSPDAKGLFRGVMALSGTPNAYWGVWGRKSSDQLAKDLLQMSRQLNCSCSTSSCAVQCMRRLPWQRLDCSVGMNGRCNMLDPDFKPVTNSNILPGTIDAMVSDLSSTRIPYIIGLVTEEFDHWNDRAMQDFVLDLLQRVYDSAVYAETLQYVYTNWQRVHRYHNNSLQDFHPGEAFTDIVFTAPTEQLIGMLTSHSQDVYHLVFHNQSAYHSIDLNYGFGVPFLQQPLDDARGYCERGCPTSEAEKRRSRTVMRLWASFFTNGSPDVISTPSGDQVTWQKASYNNLEYLYLAADQVEMRTRYKANKVAFWNVLLPKILLQYGNWSSGVPDRDPLRSNSMDDRTWVFVFLAVIILLVILSLVIYHVAKQQATRPPSSGD